MQSFKEHIKNSVVITELRLTVLGCFDFAAFCFRCAALCCFVPSCVWSTVFCWALHCCLILCWSMLCSPMLRWVVYCYVVLWCSVQWFTSCFSVLRSNVLCWASLCCALSSCEVLYHVMLCFIAQCSSKLWFSVLLSADEPEMLLFSNNLKCRRTKGKFKHSNSHLNLTDLRLSFWLRARKPRNNPQESEAHRKVRMQGMSNYTSNSYAALSRPADSD